MVTITDRNGQLCNRLYHFSFFIANAIEYDYKLIYPYLDEYRTFFESTKTNWFDGYPVSIKVTNFRLFNRLILKYISQLEKILPKAIVLDISSMGTEFDMNSGEYVEKAKNKTILTKGWEFRDEKNLKKHSETLRHFFTPVDGYKHIVRQIFLNLRSQFDCIIGVHIRKGDYRGWEGGKYFFSDEVYLNRMEGLNREVTEQGKTCCFFICSNEAVNQTLFANLNTNIEQRHAMVDLYCLAECDYIMGPPSTFSFWASFYGNKPIHTIKNMNEAIALDAFSHYYK